MHKYPIYIVSKGRWESRYTSISLESIGLDYRIVIEPQEYAEYSAVIDPLKILTLPFSDLGEGSIPARNWIWEHSIKEGHTRHWILDDNINGFYRFNRNEKARVTDGSIFTDAEVFVDRYSNIALAGFQYSMFIMRKKGLSPKKSMNGVGSFMGCHPPMILNTRIYSCILVCNDLPFRWRGMYNEDTDLSIRVLKAGFCTVLFNAFLAGKMATMTMKGGNTDSLYLGDGRLRMALSLKEQHPDVVKISCKRYGRWQHLVNYRSFKGNKFRPIKEL